MYQFSDKTDNVDPQDTKCANFQAKWKNLTFLSQIWPRMNFKFEIKKQMLKQESGYSRYHVCQLLDKTNNFDFFGPNLPKKEFKVGNS